MMPNEVIAVTEKARNFQGNCPTPELRFSLTGDTCRQTHKFVFVSSSIKSIWAIVMAQGLVSLPTKAHNALSAKPPKNSHRFNVRVSIDIGI